MPHMPAVVDEHCGKCGYDLTGLPLAGTCPECGQVYDVLRHRGIRMAESSTQRGDRVAARLRTVAWGIAAVLCLGCGGGLAMVVPNADTAWLMGAIFAGVCVLGGITSYIYERPE